jgi:hypothetical protein
MNGPKTKRVILFNNFAVSQDHLRTKKKISYGAEELEEPQDRLSMACHAVQTANQPQRLLPYCSPFRALGQTS